MSLPNSRSDLLAAHVSAIADEATDITQQFYERLFDQHPEVRAMFHRNESDAQQKMLADTIGLAVLNADDVSAIADQLHGLGVQHRDYGDIAPAHYTAVATCLLETLEQLAPDEWTEPIQEAWSSLLTEVAQHMQRGHFGD